MNFVLLRTQSSVPIFTWECDYWLDCFLPLLILLFLHLYFLPPPFLLYPTLGISLHIPRYGEHFGNWLLARSVSLLLIPPLLLLVTYISLLSLLFSIQLCELLWVSLTMEKLFIINIDVLSPVLYRWRSLEATVRIRLKSRDRRLNIKTWEHQRTPDSREY